MREQVGSAPFERTQPRPDRLGMAPEPFVLANRPPHDEGINRAEFRPKLRGIEPAVVTHPSGQDGSYPAGYILQLQVVAPMQSPASHASAHPLGGRTTDRRKKTDKRLPVRLLADRGLNV